MTTPPRRQTLNRARLFRDLGYTPHPGQIEVHRSLARKRVVACGVRWGKSMCAAMEGIAAALEPCERSIGWVVAPTYDLADRVFREIQIVAYKHLRHRIVTMKEGERRLILRNMQGGLSEIRGKSADNPVSLLGEGLDWLIVDEAARLKPVIWESHLTQRLIDKKGWALLISTPKGKGWYFDAFRRGQGRDDDTESWNQPTWNNPHLDPTIIDAERGKLPERVFLQEYGAQFVEGSGAVFRNVRELATGTFSDAEQGRIYHGGLDLAKVEDYTVLTIIDSMRRVVQIDRWNRIDWNLQVARVRGITGRYKRPRVTVDTTGVGDPIHESLRMHGVWVEAYPFTQRSKTALIDNLSMMMEQRLLVLPKPQLCPELIDELESFEYSVSERGNVSTSAPHGGHDDCVISLALAAWNVRPGRPKPGFFFLEGRL